MLTKLRDQYQKDPARTGPIIGALIGAGAALAVAIISLLLHHADTVNPVGGGGGYGLLIGFVILPLTFLASAPWGLIGLMAGGKAVPAIIGGVLGLIINGSLCGWAVGTRAKARSARKDTT